uniref:Mas-related G-protein coupled receptor member H-like n=1 Tax=Pelodiscus sinensis TaxID=13735 RepID=K7EWG2_PELSI
MTEPCTTFLPPTMTDFNHSNTNNGNECSKDSFTDISINSVTLLICLLGLMGNGTVLWFLGFRIKRNTFTVYILNLGIADFGFLLFLGVSLTMNMMNHFFCLDLEWRPFLLLFLFTYNTSLYLLTAISIERCISVFFPLWSRCRRPKPLSALVCALLWVFSSLLIGLVCHFCLLNPDKKCLVTVISMNIFNFLVFTPIMVLSNLILSIKVRCSSQRRQPRKLYAVILLTILFFLVFAVPLSIQCFMLYFNYFLFSNETCFMLASLNSSINPVIYFLIGSYKKRRFQGSVKVVLQRVFEEKADIREDGETQSANPMEMAT